MWKKGLYLGVRTCETSDVKQRNQRSQHNSPNPNNSYKTKKKFTGSYTEVNPKKASLCKRPTSTRSVFVRRFDIDLNMDCRCRSVSRDT